MTKNMFFLANATLIMLAAPGIEPCGFVPADIGADAGADYLPYEIYDFGVVRQTPDPFFNFPVCIVYWIDRAATLKAVITGDVFQMDRKFKANCRTGSLASLY